MIDEILEDAAEQWIRASPRSKLHLPGSARGGLIPVFLTQWMWIITAVQRRLAKWLTSMWKKAEPWYCAVGSHDGAAD